MPTAVLIVLAAGVCALVASWFMWWSTKRSAAWAMLAASFAALVVLVCAVVIAWLITRAVYGG